MALGLGAKGYRVCSYDVGVQSSGEDRCCERPDLARDASCTVCALEPVLRPEDAGRTLKPKQCGRYSLEFGNSCNARCRGN